MNKSDILNFDELQEGSWIWCLHCEQCYRKGEYRLIHDLRMCPYPECDGDTILDAWEWDHLRKYHPDYPEEPERDTRYPEY